MKTDGSGLVRAYGLTGAAATDRGRVRDHNEDVFHLDLENGVWLVVDGVGGHNAGEIAAGLAATTIRRRLERRDGPADQRVREAITLANQEILRAAAESPERAGMACVLTLAVLDGRQLTIGHVGDSRMYRLDARGITKLTHDHSPVGEREDARALSEIDAMQHAQRNEVYRDVGSEPRDPDAPDFIELVRVTADDDAAFLMCSDGLTDMLPALEINRIVRRHAGAPDAAVAALIAAANDVGGRDNVTVLLVEGPGFRGTPDGGQSFPPPEPEGQRVPTLPLGDLMSATEGEHRNDARPETGEPRTGTTTAPPRASASRRLARSASALVTSRAAMLLLGGLVGFGTAMRVADDPAPAPSAPTSHRLVVGTAADDFHTIGDALAAATWGDVVEVAGGEYRESIAVPAGVTLAAAPGATPTLLAPAGTTPWTAVDAQTGAIVKGMRIVGTPDAPIDRGVIVRGADVRLEELTMEGSMAVGIEVLAPAAVLRASRIDRLTGTPIALVAPGTATLRHNVFRAADGARLAVNLAADTTISLDGNVFVHFPRLTNAANREASLLAPTNIVVPAATGRARAR